MGNNIGGQENVATGNNALRNTSFGSSNTAQGFFALFTNTTGSNNTALGNRADVSSGSLINATAIGSGAIVDASNKVRIGNASVTVVEIPVAPTVFSDRRLKENIADAELGLDFLLQLHPVQYTLKTGNGRTDYGFIAQELKTVLANKNVNMLNKDGEFYTVRYNDFISPMVKAVQEQQKLIEDLQSKIKLLEDQATQKDSTLNVLQIENSTLQSNYSHRLEKLEEALGIKAQK